MRRISRRELLGLGAAAGMVAVSGTSADAVPARSGSLRLGLTGRGIRAFDGRIPFDPVMRILGHGAVFDCLTEIGPDGAITGELATEWTASPDARVWSFRLRDDAVFHDGRPFGAEDVVATLKLHMTAAREGDTSLAAGIAQVRRLGPQSVQIVLKSGNPGLPFLLSDPQLVMLPAASPDAAMVAGIGTGLYRLDSGTTSERAVLKRVESHYKDGRAGWFERIEMLVMPTPASRLEALMLGRVDAVNMADPAWLPALRRHGRLAQTAVTGTAFVEIAVEGVAGAEAQRIACAVAQRLDREAVLSAALHGHGCVLDPAGRDAPEVARMPVSVEIAPARVPGAEALAREVTAAAHRAGLVPSAGAAARIVARLRPGRPTEDWSLSLEGPEPVGDYALRLAEARATLDAGERARRFATLQAEVAARPVIVPVAADGLMAHSTRLRHAGRIGALWDMDSARIAERWWYA